MQPFTRIIPSLNFDLQEFLVTAGLRTDLATLGSAWTQAAERLEAGLP